MARTFYPEEQPQTIEELPITARLPVADIHELETLAAASDRSRSAEIRRAVRAYLDAKKATA